MRGTMRTAGYKQPLPFPYDKTPFKVNYFHFYRAMHFSAYAQSWDRMSSVRPSVRPSVTLVDCDHIG